MWVNLKHPSNSDIVTISKRKEIKKKIGGLGNHYGGQGCGYENLKIQIIDQVEIGDTEALAEAEVFWQNQLRVYIQNAHCRRKEKT